MATAARVGSRVDAGLLAGCVLLSLIATVLPARNDRDSINVVRAALRQTAVAPLVSLQKGAERWRTAWATSERRQIVTDSLALRAVKAQALQSENEQLRKLLGLGTRLEWGFVPAEALHSTTPTNEELVTTLTLTAGSSTGIQRYSPVVAPEGLVGVVQTADPGMSIAILYTHPDFRASATTADGTAFGMVYPHSSRSRGEAYMLELRGVPIRIELKPGTPVYTSGLGHTYPRGILIGNVAGQLKNAEGWTRTYLIQPAVSPSRVTSVFVLTAQRVTQGTGNIWGSAVNADSASRRMAAAGDSLARQAALLQAQARQAALDSVKRATIDSVRRSLGATVPMTAADSAALRGVQPAPTGTGTTPRRDSTRARRDTLRRDSIRTPST